MSEFEILELPSGKFTWRLVAHNKLTIARGEEYSSKSACKNGIESVIYNVSKADINDKSK